MLARPTGAVKDGVVELAVEDSLGGSVGVGETLQVRADLSSDLPWLMTDGGAWGRASYFYSGVSALCFLSRSGAGAYEPIEGHTSVRLVDVPGCESRSAAVDVVRAWCRLERSPGVELPASGISIRARFDAEQAPILDLLTRMIVEDTYRSDAIFDLLPWTPILKQRSRLLMAARFLGPRHAAALLQVLDERAVSGQEALRLALILSDAVPCGDCESRAVLARCLLDLVKSLDDGPDVAVALHASVSGGDRLSELASEFIGQPPGPARDDVLAEYIALAETLQRVEPCDG
ncbi:MAG: hypothetical protein H6825_11700 [Planctomycetes bacterium]|nr:hypothetical protein [Planctomycetota bacterium]